MLRVTNSYDQSFFLLILELFLTHQKAGFFHLFPIIFECVCGMRPHADFESATNGYNDHLGRELK